MQLICNKLNYTSKKILTKYHSKILLHELIYQINFLYIYNDKKREYKAIYFEYK